MLYDAYEVQRSLLAGASRLAGLGAGWLSNPSNPWGYSSMGPVVAAGLEVFAHAAAPRGKPDFGIDSVRVEGEDVAVNEEILLRKPFGQLKHFYREGVETGPRLLIVAPMSGHYATLLRGTVERLPLDLLGVFDRRTNMKIRDTGLLNVRRAGLHPTHAWRSCRVS